MKCFCFCMSGIVLPFLSIRRIPNNLIFVYYISAYCMCKVYFKYMFCYSFFWIKTNSLKSSSSHNFFILGWLLWYVRKIYFLKNAKQYQNNKSWHSFTVLLAWILFLSEHLFEYSAGRLYDFHIFFFNFQATSKINNKKSKYDVITL